MFKYIFWVLAFVLLLSGVFMFLVRGTDSKTSLPNTANNAPVRLTEPVRNQIVTSPLNIRGDALGTWFFEANMPDS